MGMVSASLRIEEILQASRRAYEQPLVIYRPSRPYRRESWISVLAV